MSMKMPILAPAFATVSEALPEGNFLFAPDGPSAESEFLHSVKRACLAKSDWDPIGKSNFERARQWSHEQAAEALCGIT